MIKPIKYNAAEGEKLVREMLERNAGGGQYQAVVDEIIAKVRQEGDKALFDYTERFDKAKLDSFLLSEEEIEEAYTQVAGQTIGSESGNGKNLLDIIRCAAARIRSFHEKQKQNSWFEPSESGEILGQIIRPIESCGVYVPGGKAAYPSSVLMNIIPAQVAGVKNIYMVTPPDAKGKLTPSTIVAAVECGVKTIFKVGGAQAIAALAFGTESIPKVDKIVGPGNIFVALAKRSVFGHVNIDSVAGPSEILIIADKEARADYVAADMLSQAEHDELASAILVTDCPTLAESVSQELSRQTALLGRQGIIEKSLQSFGRIFVVADLQEAAKLANTVAPEHLEIYTQSPFELLPQIKNAGAIFLGPYSPEPVGDYMAGPNHVLPTGGTARFFSPLSVDDFIKKSSLISFTKDALLNIGSDVVAFAQAEGLTAHANSVKIRLKE